MNAKTPYLDGFRLAVHPDYRPPDLTPPLLKSWQMTISEYANHYRCSIRTIERIKAAGVDIDKPELVAAHLVNVQSPSLPMLERVGQLLDELESPPAIQ